MGIDAPDDEPLDVEGLGLDDLGFAAPEPAKAMTSPPASTEEPGIASSRSEDDPLAWIVKAAKAAPPAEVSASSSGDDDWDDDFGAGIVGEERKSHPIREVAESATEDEEVEYLDMEGDEQEFLEETEEFIEELDDLDDEDFGGEISRESEKKKGTASASRDAYWDALEKWDDSRESGEAGAKPRDRNRESGSERDRRPSREKSTAGPREESGAKKPREKSVAKPREESASRRSEEAAPAGRREKSASPPRETSHEKPREQSHRRPRGEKPRQEVVSEFVEDDFGAGVLEPPSKSKRSEAVVREKKVEPIPEEEVDEVLDEVDDTTIEFLEEVADDDFGAGLDDESPTRHARRRPPSKERARTEAEAPPLPEKKPRREQRPSRPEAEKSTPPVSESRRSGGRRSERSRLDSEFVEEEREERTERRRPERPRVERRPVEPEEPAEEADEQDVLSKQDRYAGIPSWEYAISLLSLKQPKPGSGSRRPGGPGGGRGGRGGGRRSGGGRTS